MKIPHMILALALGVAVVASTNDAYAQTEELQAAGFGGLDFAVIFATAVAIPFIVFFGHRAYLGMRVAAEKASEDRERERSAHIAAEERAREDSAIQRARYLSTVAAISAGANMARINETEETSKQAHQAPVNYPQPRPYTTDKAGTDGANGNPPRI